MTTLVLSRRHSPDSNSLWRAALDQGWDVERLRDYNVPEDLGARDPVIYGETIFADAVSETLGLCMLEPSPEFLPDLPFDYKKREVARSTLGQARRLREKTFIKPADEKWFPARVYENGSAILAGPEVSDELIVLTSEPVHWLTEFRVFCVERKIAAISPYLIGGELAKDASGEWIVNPIEMQCAADFAERLLGDFNVHLPPAAVVDVGRIEHRGFAVVEANPAWASGICACDARQVLSVLRRASVPLSNLSAADKDWIRRPQVL